jgi:hypothetical protein
MRDDRARKPVLLVDLADPAALADLVGPVPFGFAMHRRQHVVIRGVAAIILGQVVLPERRVVAHEEVLLLATAQPRVPAHAQIPQVMVRVDQGHGVGTVIPLVMDRVHVAKLAQGCLQCIVAARTTRSNRR